MSHVNKLKLPTFKKSPNSTRKVECAGESKMKVAFSLLTCRNERHNCCVKTCCFMLDWLLGLGCVEEWRFPNTYRTLQLPSSGWRNLESKRTATTTHSKRWDTASSWTNMKQGLAPAFPSLLNSRIPITFAQQLNTSHEDHTHRSSDDKRNHLHLSTLHPPSHTCQIPSPFLHNSPSCFKSFGHMLAKTLL